MANTYTYHGPGERWVEGQPTAEDRLNVARENADHLHEALNTIMDTDLADGVLLPLGGIDLNGTNLIFDADGDSKLYAAADDVVALNLNNAEAFRWLVGGMQVPDDTWIGLGVSAGRITFDATATPDTITVSDASLVANGIVNIATATNWQLGAVAFTGSMANLNTLRDDSMADALHRHSELSASDGTPNPAVYVDTDGQVLIGTVTKSAFAAGPSLLVAQGTNDDNALTFQASEVAHPFTGDADATTWGDFRKAEDTSGGLQIRGYKDSAGIAGYALSLIGYLGEAADDTKSTAGYGIINANVAVTNGGAGGQAVAANGNLFSVRNYNTTAWILDAGGDTWQTGGITTGAALSCINDTTNANMTVGLTINQGAADDEILALKSSDVAHGRTTFAETDTYAYFRKGNPTGGGLEIQGISDADTPTGNASLYLKGFTADAALDTTKSTIAFAAVAISTGVTDGGTGCTAPGADQNLVVIQAYDTTRFIFDAEGSGHADVEWTTFDAHDDLALVRDIEREMIPGQFGESLTYNRDALERVGIIGKGSWHEENGKQHAMINFTKLQMLHHGAIDQIGSRVESAEERIGHLEDAVAARELEIAELRQQLNERN